MPPTPTVNCPYGQSEVICGEDAGKLLDCGVLLAGLDGADPMINA